MRRQAKAPSAGSTSSHGTSRGLFGLACLCVLSLAAFLGSSAPSAPGADAFPGQGFLPDNRAWEMVSPPAKNGGDVAAASARTRAAADGSAVGFSSLAGFADVHGTGVATDYIAQRSTDPDPGDNGWSTHAITPLQDAVGLLGLVGSAEPLYRGEFSGDLDNGVFSAWSPLTDAPNVKDVQNLYLRSDLRTPGPGAYQLLTACPLCDATETPLPPTPVAALLRFRPRQAGTTPDLGHVIFESRLNLTNDAPAQPTGAQGCDPASAVLAERCRTRLYEWDHGTVRLAGILPDGSAADVSIAGQGAGASHAAFLTPHTISDGSDGHIRIFFTQPTDASGQTSSQVAAGSQKAINGATKGRLFVRTDATATDQLNASERTAPDTFAPATFLDASAGGTRAFFMSPEALTDDAPADGQGKIYMYDATKPASALDNLTFITPDGELGDGADAFAMIGASDDGLYAYLLVTGQLVGGEPTGGTRIYLWHDGEITHVGRGSPTGSALNEILGSGMAWDLRPKQARVTPDGRHLLFSTLDGAGLTGYDHGNCVTGLGDGCRELYVYSADADSLQCASCNPSGAPATTMASALSRDVSGAAQTDSHQPHPLSADGRYVFFSTAEHLVAADTNGQSDAYLYDTTTGKPRLLSSGEDSNPSYFLDASADGSNAFIATAERLSGWDFDNSYDVYDARVEGGFPEPPPPPPSCQGDACQPAPMSLDDPTPASSSFKGPGNQVNNRKSVRCAKGQRKVRVRGKTRCVKRKRSKRDANSNRRASR